MATRKTLVIVPTYNEIENIAGLLKAIEKEAPSLDVLVVDDNSPDGTASVVESMMGPGKRLHLLRRPGKQGLGVAYKAGFTWGIENKYDNLIQMDADFSHPPDRLPAMVQAMETQSIVTGSRYIPNGEVSGWGITRKVISRGGNIYARNMLGLRAQDVTGGFNGWRREVLEAINYSAVASQGYVFQIELKYRSMLKGYHVFEIPIHFANRIKGKSKMSGAIFWEAAVCVFKLRTSARQLVP
jgi:dolichol-phosphate mannosyltransferase